jgi:hypothetical protein
MRERVRRSADDQDFRRLKLAPDRGQQRGVALGIARDAGQRGPDRAGSGLEVARLAEQVITDRADF